MSSYCDAMSKSLALEIQKLIERKGKVAAMTTLCLGVGKSERTVQRWIQLGVPTPNDTYKLALACGLSEQKALALAGEDIKTA